LRDTTVAARYARALFIISEKRKETPRVLEDLKGVAQVLEPGSRIGNFFATPEVRMAAKRAALTSGFENKATRTVIVFVDLLLRKKRLGELTTIVSEFVALVEKAQGIQRAHVVSAVPLLKPELDKLHQELETLTKKTIQLTTEVDASLVGGALVRIGDRVIDRSVRTLLETISRQLAETHV
jgi:F-type H+-transporting ATPase subunit delta